MKRKKNTQTPGPFSAYLTADGTRLTPIEESTDFSDGVCIYVINKEEIEACDTARLIHDLLPHPDNPIFAAGPGRVVFWVDGYGEGPRDPLLIPEFRAFIRKAEQASPCWIYFAAPQTAWIRIVLAASGRQCLVSDKGDGTVLIGLDTGDLQRFLGRQIRAFRSHCHLSGVAGKTANDHLDTSVNLSFPNCPPLGHAN